MFALSFLIIISSITAQAGTTTAKRIEIAEVGFSTPESVEYYAAEDVYLVGNINGSPLAVDGNGFISKIKPDGTVIDLKWIDGTKEGVTLSAPKGMAITDNILFVADINEVQLFDLPGGAQKASISIKGSTFLNGVTPGEGGSVYVTDSGITTGFKESGTDAIYKVTADGTYTTVVADKEMGRPNGIVARGTDLIVVTFGSGKVYRIDDKGKRHAMPTPPKGSLDGLIRLDDGRLLMSSWDGSAVYVLGIDGAYSILAGDLAAPADMGYDTKRNRLLVPLFNLNKIVLLAL